MYRGDQACDAHSLTAAVGHCYDCWQRVCDGCERFESTVPRCPACARRVSERRRTLARLAHVALFALALMTTLSMGWVLGTAISEQDPPPVALYSLAR